MPTSHVMKVSRNGQVSIPAETRARWATDHVIVVDLGDRVVLRPTVDDPIGSLRGSLRSALPESDSLRRLERSAADDRERQH